MDKKVLMIAFHFPPLKGSSGIQRTLKFCQYLPIYGWQPIVLSVNERAYEEISQEQLNDISPNTIVRRTFALDTKQHLSIMGRYPIYFVIPDRWISWLPFGLAQGICLAHKFRPTIIWSTYPIATAHLIGYVLHRMTKIPWIADLRDPMAQDGYPENPIQWKSFKWIEDRIAKYASAICFTSPSAVLDFINKHPAIVNKERLHLIENGYDEESFQQALQFRKLHPINKNRPLTLLHSGIIYPSERDPRPFFKAISHLKKSGLITSSTVNIIFRATCHDDLFSSMINANNLEDIVKLVPPLPYIEALAEMLDSDGLILFQAANCNYQIPAKLYEYLRTGRPILGLIDKKGDTAKILSRYPNHKTCDIALSEEIETTFVNYLNELNTIESLSNYASDLTQYSRQKMTEKLADLLNSILK